MSSFRPRLDRFFNNQLDQQQQHQEREEIITITICGKQKENTGPLNGRNDFGSFLDFFSGFPFDFPLMSWFFH